MRYGAALLTVVLVYSIASGTPQEVARKMFPKTVMVVVQDREGRPLAFGSGFTLKPGLVVTNYHVIENAGSGFVKLVDDKTKYKISGVVAKDEAHDLAILSVEAISTEGATLSQRPTVEVGETVFAIGNPRGLEGTFSQGIVSSLRKLDEFTLLQITAPISPGSSGGPIVDEKGEVVGVAVAFVRGGQNLNFAIPTKYVGELAAHVGKVAPLAETKPDKANKPLLTKLEAGKSVDGVTVGSFLWEDTKHDGTVFSISVKNNLETPIRAVSFLVIFRNAAGEVVDYSVVEYHETIPPGLAKRVTGRADSSTKRLTTPIATPHSYGVEYATYADQPAKVEYRVLGFELEQ